MNLFPLAALYLSLSLSPHDPILLFNHVYSLPPFRQLFSPPIRLMQSISQNRLDGIIRGARERTVHPLQSSSNKSNTQSIHTTHTNYQLFHFSAALGGCCVKNESHNRFWVAPLVGKQHNFSSAHCSANIWQTSVHRLVTQVVLRRLKQYFATAWGGTSEDGGSLR